MTIRQIAEERFASYMKQKESSMHMEFGQELKLGITQNDLKKVGPLGMRFQDNLLMSELPHIIADTFVS